MTTTTGHAQEFLQRLRTLEPVFSLLTTLVPPGTSGSDLSDYKSSSARSVSNVIAADGFSYASAGHLDDSPTDDSSFPIIPLREEWIYDTHVSWETAHLCRKSAQLSRIHCGFESRDTNTCH